jgi:hypothetical protein
MTVSHANKRDGEGIQEKEVDGIKLWYFLLNFQGALH